MAEFRAAGLAVMAALGFGATAQAEAVCGNRADIVAELERRYGETRQSVGLQQGHGVVELWASERTGSWTIVVTNAHGLTCLMAAGEAFEAERGKPADTPA